jgi:hypothetical protein
MPEGVGMVLHIYILRSFNFHSSQINKYRNKLPFDISTLHTAYNSNNTVLVNI